ncbi:MAG: sigma factor [Cyanobacteriota bacterium]|nr:sigma factor [Cyanobacteriota bacterium]
MAFSCAARLRQSTLACRRCSDAAECPIARRNKLVEDNLALAHSVAERYIRRSGCRGGAGPGDIHGAAWAGMVRAVERFDGSMGHQLSSYVVPYVEGAIRHHLRDHWVPLKVPRRLLELHQRGRRIQQRRLRQGLEPLPIPMLALELGSTVARLRDADTAWRLLQQIESLDSL